jgi:hypothetical protein
MWSRCDFDSKDEMSALIEELLTKSRAELDALYSAHEAGPIPDGSSEGTLIIAPGTRFTRPVTRLMKTFVWQGKVFDAQRGTMCNRILPFDIEAVVAKVYRAQSWLDGKECIVLDYSDTSIVARWIRDEIRLIAPDIYLGKAYWGRSRVLDFALAFNVKTR